MKLWSGNHFWLSAWTKDQTSVPKQAKFFIIHIQQIHFLILEVKEYCLQLAFGRDSFGKEGTIMLEIMYFSAKQSVSSPQPTTMLVSLRIPPPRNCPYFPYIFPCASNATLFIPLLFKRLSRSGVIHSAPLTQYNNSLPLPAQTHNNSPKKFIFHTFSPLTRTHSRNLDFLCPGTAFQA